MNTPQEPRDGPPFARRVSAIPSFGRSAVPTVDGDSSAGESAAPAAAGRAGRAEKLGRWLARWWSRTPEGRTYQRRRADALVAAAGLGVVVVCGVLVANRTLAGTDVVVFQRINHWPGWLYPPMWAVQLSGVIGALALVAAPAALLRRLRLAVALAAATLLKVWLEAVAKTFVQRARPAETLHHVILRGQSAAHGLSFPSGHAMVIFAITVLVAPYFKGWWKVLPWALGAAVCLSRVYLGAHFPLDVVSGAALGVFIGGVLNLAIGVPGASSATARPAPSASPSRRGTASPAAAVATLAAATPHCRRRSVKTQLQF